MSTRKTRRRVHGTVAASTATALTATLLLAGPAGAWADESTGEQATQSVVADALAGVESVDPELIAEPLTTGQATGTVPLGSGTVEVPTDLDAGITFTSPDGDTLTVRPTDSAAAESATALDDGTVVFPGDTSASSVIVAEQGVQMLTTITDETAPTRYSYDLDLEAGEHLDVVDGGAVVTDADGTVLLAAAAPWATDAEGAAVPTRYEVDGSTLTQVVDHTAVDAAYPVVADPIWLAPWVVKCLIGLGIKGPDITRIASMGTPAAILAAFGRAAVACIFGK
jgi:hypothetical protein